MSLDQVRAVADAVLYEGYLLYPYRASSRKNRTRWQFGVLGPPGASDAGFGEEPGMAVHCLLLGSSDPSVRVHLRFLQLQTRTVERYEGQGDCFEPVEQLVVGNEQWLSWDEAVEQEVVLDLPSDELRRGAWREVSVGGHESVEELTAPTGEPARAGSPAVDARARHVVGRVVRRRWPLHALVTATTVQDDGCTRLEVRVENDSEECPPGTHTRSRDVATRTSLVGTHLILEADGGRFVSVIDPPRAAAAAARRCSQHRCWPVLAGERPDPTASGGPPGPVTAGGRPGPAVSGAGDETVTSSVVLGSPIILYDFPEVAEQSAGSLFDATEIDEILTLRVMTMTQEEKAEARATDEKAREIIDRCDHLSPESLQQLHGILHNPHAAAPDPGTVAGAPWPGPPERDGGAADIRDVDPPSFGEPEVPWWDPAADEAVRPELDSVVVDGVRVSRGSLVRVRPSRRADAQDLFFAGQVARVTAVLSDVDGGVHVALVLDEDPAADLHDWYGRYWYFAPDELEPLPHRDAEDPPTEPR